METKSIKLIFILLINICASSLSAQENNILDIKSIKIDTISLNNARYKPIEFGTIINTKKWTEEFEEYSRAYTEIHYESIIVLSYRNSRDKIFIDWIKVTGSNHKIKIGDILLQVNDSITNIERTLPIVYKNYMDFILKNKQNKSINYFGIKLNIETGNRLNEHYYGALKFGIRNGIIKEIMIDLRPDGEYD